MTSAGSSGVHNLTENSIDSRIRGAIWGQFAGDAFCLGSHWIYDLTELERRFPGGPQGFESPVSGHYHFGKRSGDLTHYGDGALLLLQSLAKQGRFDAVDFGGPWESWELRVSQNPQGWWRDLAASVLGSRGVYLRRGAAEARRRASKGMVEMAR